MTSEGDRGDTQDAIDGIIDSAYESLTSQDGIQLSDNRPIAR